MYNNNEFSQTMVHGYLEKVTIVITVAKLSNWMGSKKNTQDHKYIIDLLEDIDLSFDLNVYIT